MRLTWFSVVVALVFVSDSVDAAIPTWERQALIALYDSTYGSYWFDGNGWPVEAVGTECSWTGVTCNSTGTSVIGLDLTGAGLSGTIPPELSQLGSLTTLILWTNDLFGPIPTELDRLANLEYLDLSHNSLIGEVPPSFSKLSRLEELWLENNALSGPIPASLGELQSLQVLSLSFNGLTGQIPAALWNARNLWYVDLQSNELAGSIPAGIANLRFLLTLDLSDNQLTGAIPWSELPGSLTYLALGSNFFSIDGALPAEIGRFDDLSVLRLGYLGFTSIPAEIGLLDDLVELDLAGNGLANVPPELGQLQKLDFFDLSENLFESIPDAVTELSGMTTLRFRWNFATTVPSTMSRLGSLEALYLEGNHFETVPAVLGTLPSLAILDLSWNSLESADLTSGFQSLDEIYLSYNYLTQFPAVALPGLRVLDLTGNYLTGPLPAGLEVLSSLELLSLWENELEGPVPSELRHLRSLTYLDLGWNRFTGGVPSWLNELENLETLYLDHNRLEGTISDLSSMKSLSLLWLNDNRLGGAVPAHLANLGGLDFLVLYGNRFDGSLPRELASMKLVWLDLSGNFLTGAIPPEYGNSQIQFLLLEKNNLRGVVPENFRARELLYTNLEHNAVTASPEVTAILQASASFVETQTLPPGNVTVSSVTPYTVDLRWAPISYRDGGGGYQVQLSATPGGPYTPVLTTNDKGEEGATVTGLSPSTRYYGVIKTVSYPFSVGTLQQRNRIFSDPTPEFTFTTGPPIQTAAQIAVTSRPRGMVQAPGVGGGSDSYTVTNVGGTPTTVSVSTTDTFFTQSPPQFTLQPGLSAVVSLSGVAVPAGSFRGMARVSGVGVPAGLTVPVSLLSLEPPEEEPVVRAVSSRIDLSAPAEENPVAEVVYENVSDVKFSGILVSDVEFLVPPLDLIEIEPNTRVTVEVVTDRSKRPDAALLAGAAAGKVFLLSLGEKNTFGKGPVTASETTSTTLVTVVDTVKPKTVVAPLAPLAASEIAFVVPHVGHVTSPSGIYISDVTVLNGSTARVSRPQMFYRSLDPRAPTMAATLPTLGSRQLVSYGDVVTSVFEQREQVGTLVLRGVSDQTSIIASIFNSSDPRGLYGTTIPAFRSDRAVGRNGEIVLTGLRKNATQYTNLFLQEVRGGTAVANVVFLNAVGEPVGTDSRVIGPFSLSRITGAAVPNGSVAARITNAGEGGLVAYATPVDRSGDSWTVADWSQLYGTDPGGKVVIPVGGAAVGANNTDFRTDVAITNRCTRVLDPRVAENQGTTCTEKVADVAVRYVWGGQSLTRSIEIPLGHTVELNDLVRNLFEVPGNTVGYFEIEPRNGSLAVTSRTYDLSANGSTFGSTVPALGSLNAIRVGQSRVVPGLEDANLTTQQARVGGTRRTNFGLVEVGGASVRVKVSVSFSVVTSSLTKSVVQQSRVFDLPAGGFMSLSRIVSTVMGVQRDQILPDLSDVTAEFTVIEGEGALMIYTSSVDNGTADSVIRVE